jgi:hypothetical protein
LGHRPFTEGLPPLFSTAPQSLVLYATAVATAQTYGGEHFTAPFTVTRLLTPLNMSYETAKKRAAPYNKVVEVLPQMRKETVTLIKQATGENRRAYVLVNNRSRGMRR